MATSARTLAVWLGASACAPTVSPDQSPSEQTAVGTTDSDTVRDTDSVADTADTADTAAEPPGETSPCGLSVSVAEPFFLEGDTVTFTVACARSDLADATVTLAGAGAGATLDARTGIVSWATDGRSGGRYDVTVGASGGGVLESEVVTVWIADNPEAPEARAPIPREYTEEWGLPVVHVDTDAALTESEQDATITVRDQQVTGFAKIRGASSTSYPKVSYTLDFESDELGVTEWGDRTREHMVLITSFDDNSYIRQKLGYDLWMAMAEHQDVQRLTPRTFFTVLYLNGQYQGIYTACDRIDDEFLRHMGTGGEGSLYKSVSHDANFYSYDARGQTKSWLGIGYEKKEGDPADWADLDALVTLTGLSDNDTLWANHPGIEMEEFADWLIWAQFSLAQDSAGKNAYLFADPEAGRWRLTPWDLNESWGQNWYTLRLPASARNDYFWNNRLFALLQQHPEGRALVEARYRDLRDDGPLQVSVLNQMIDEYKDTLGPNIGRDWQRWGSAYRSFDRWRGDRERAGDWTTPDEELAYVRTWIEDRLAMYDADGPF